MRIIVAWLRLESRRRWRSLLVLALLVALAAGRCWRRPRGPAAVRPRSSGSGRPRCPRPWPSCPTSPEFDWAKVRGLPEVAALSEFAVVFGFSVDCCPTKGSVFPPIGDELNRTIERPVMLAGRPPGPGRVGEVMVTPQFAATYHKGVGDTMTLHLATPKQMDTDYDGSTGPPLGPRIRARITGIGRSVWGSVTTDGPGFNGGVIASPALYADYRANLIGTSGQQYINALIRLKGGAADIPAFRAGLARVTGRSDIDVLEEPGVLRRLHPAGHRVRGRLPARLRAGRAGGRAVPDRPVGGQVHLGRQWPISRSCRRSA